MLVMKFGGSALAQEAALARVLDLIHGRLREQPVVVCSALSGVTDELQKVARDAAKGDLRVDSLYERHCSAADSIGIRPECFDPLFSALRTILQGIVSRGRVEPRCLDCVSAFGERLSTTLLAAGLRARGIAAQAVMADEAGLVTDSTHGAARPLVGSAQALRMALQAIEGVAVVTGYLGRDSAGHVTTLGRNSSDFSAVFVAATVGASRVELWTDVSGVLSGSPDHVPVPQRFDLLGYEDAERLALSGAKVLHAGSLGLARRHNLILHVRSIIEPKATGTIIRSLEGAELLAAAVLCRRLPEGREIVIVLPSDEFEQWRLRGRELLARNRISVLQESDELRLQARSLLVPEEDGDRAAQLLHDLLHHAEPKTRAASA
jgi:aspartate kinase